MATSSDYFTPLAISKPATIRTRTAPAVTSPTSPRTPLLGRSISSQFGSPGNFRSEQEDFIVYELGARHVSAGFAGESRPRCIIGIGPNDARRVGDFRQYDPSYSRKRKRPTSEADWSVEHEFYPLDLREVDLGLVEDKLERTVRRIHTDFLQLDNKPRKAAIVVPSLLPIPLLEIAVKVLFSHHTQPPSIVLLPSPVMACVGAGLRNGLIVNIGWEETVVTAIGEYKEILQRRSIRAGRRLTTEVAKLLAEEMAQHTSNDEHDSNGSDISGIPFEHADEVTLRFAWCKSLGSSSERTTAVKIPVPGHDSDESLSIPFSHFADSTAKAFLATAANDTSVDDHDRAIPALMHEVLLAVPPDLRASCVSRIVVTGRGHSIPGLKLRLLEELQQLVDTRGWDPVHRYGSATNFHQEALQEQRKLASRFREQRESDAAEPEGGSGSLAPAKKPIQDAIPHSQRIHDDQFDHISRKTEREAAKGAKDVVIGVVRGVETLGAWSGASLVANLRVKGTCEVERDEFLRHGLRDVNF